MSLKLHNPKSHAPAVYIPCWLIQVSVKLLSEGAKLLYGRLSQWCNESGQVYRSCQQLSFELGTPVRTIERRLKELKDVKLIGTFHPQAGGVNHFEFYDHPWMHEQINNNLTYPSQPPTNLVLDKNNTNNPPSKLSVPHVKIVGTPPSKVADINNKEIKEDTTTTGDQILTKDFPLEPVVVFSSSSLTPDEKKSTKFLTSLYEENHFVTNNILGLEDFLSAAYWLIKNRGEILLYKRHSGIKTLVESGRFEGDEEWIKLRTKERNRKIGDEKQKIIEQQMREKAPISNKSNNINSSKCLSSLLSELTGKENYKESKIMESEKQKKQKKEIEKNLVKPINGFTRIRLPEELGSSSHANQQGKAANIC